MHQTLYRMDFKYNFVEDLPDKYRCRVCQKLLKEPQYATCCHKHICLKCCEQKIDPEQTHTQEKCPNCQSKNFTHVLYKPLKEEINQLEIYCPNQSQGCEKTMTFMELRSHLSTTNPNGCDYVKVECPHEASDCCELIMRKDLVHHSQQLCTKRPFSCEYCQTIGPHYYITKYHTALDCLECPVNCRRECMTENLRRKDLEKHKKVCPLETIPCLYQEVGCTQELLRKDEASHLKSNTKQHLDLAYRAYKNLEVSEQSLRLTIGTQIEHTQKTVPEAATSLERSAKILDGDFLMEQEGEYLKFRLPSDFKHPVSPSFQISNKMVMYIAVNSADTQSNISSTLSLLLLRGDLDGQFEIRVEEKCEQRTNKPLIQHRGSYRESDSNVKLCGRCSNPQGQTSREGREIGRVPMPPDFEGGYYKYCVVTLILKAHHCSYTSQSDGTV